MDSEVMETTAPTQHGWKQNLPYLLVLLAPILALFKALFQGEAIGPWDHIAKMVHPGSPLPNSAWDVLQADGVLQFYVWRDLVFSAWGKGEIPFWNPYELAGTPLLANSQSGALYPLHVLCGLLHLPTASAITALAFFHLVWAGLGVSYLVRRAGGSVIGATIAGMAFSACPFMTSWTPLASVITTVSWIPWLIGGAILSADRISIKRAAFTGFCAAMLVLSGHLQFTAYGFIGFGLVLAWSLGFGEGVLSNRVRTATLSLLAVAVFGAISALPALIPVLKNGETSHRRNAPSEEGFKAYIGSSIAPYELVGLASPKLLGDPMTPFDPTSANRRSGYWPKDVRLGANLAEGAVFVLPMLLVLAAFGLKQSWRASAGLLLLAAVGLSTALGGPLNQLLYFNIPGWSATGSPGRILVLGLIALCASGGVGLSRWAEQKPLDATATQAQKLTRAAWVASPLLLLAACFNGLQMVRGSVKNILGVPDDAFAAYLNQVSSQGMIYALALALITVVGLALSLKMVSRSGLVLAIAGILGVGIHALGSVRTAPFVDLTLKAPIADPGERVAVVMKNWDMFGTPDVLLPPNLLALSRIPELSGYDSILDVRFVNQLKDALGSDPAPVTNGNMILIKPGFDLEKLQAMGVDVIVSREEIPGLKMESRPDLNALVGRIPGQGRIMARDGMAKVTYDGADRQTIELAPGTKDLLIHDRYSPEWRVITPGVTMTNFDGWRFLQFPAGTAKVELVYGTPRQRQLIWVGLGFLALSMVWFCIPRRRVKA